jgi:nicotinamide-nucleotide amidase
MEADPGSELLSIGSELLLGETVDTNAAYLAAELAHLGLPLRLVRQLPDDRATLGAAFSEAMARQQLVIATGGLGPTHDDLTREGLADALGEGLREDPALRATLERRFRAFGRMPSSNLRQALRVPSAEALANPIGSAPGWWVDRPEGVVVLMPGVPAEMHRMWQTEVRPRLTRRFGATPLVVRTVKTFGVGESRVAETLGRLLEFPPDGVATGIFARDDGVHVRFSTRTDPAALDGCIVSALDALGTDVWGVDHADLAAEALGVLERAGVASVATEEWGTQGFLYAILAAGGEGGARVVRGSLDAPLDDAAADACLRVRLGPQSTAGRSRVDVSLSGPIRLPPTELRIHGSGQQRLRRAAYAALDQVRRVGAGATG